MTHADPFAVFGLTRAATLDEVRAARRRLAFEVHPDHGGDDAAMQRVNAAFEACVAHLTGRRPLVDDTQPTAPSAPPPASTTPGPGFGRRRPAPAPASNQRGRRRFVEHDAPSFTIDALPAEAFEALLVVVSWIGDVLDDDPPYVLECHLREPSPCWCRLDLVPDAGGSTVSIVVASSSDSDQPLEPGFVEQVRDVWVEHLNQLGGPLP